jgi:hypothetical protein
MPNTLDQLTSWIATRTSFAKGTDLFKGRLPDHKSTCIGLIEVLGFEPPAETFGSTVNIERPQIQILSRAGRDNYQLARNNAEIVYKAIRGATTSLDGRKWYIMDIRSSPHYQGEDDNSRHVVTFTVDIWKQPSS